MWTLGSTGNRISASKIEERGKVYLEENYPGVYEQVKTQNSGTAYQQQDGTWSLYYFGREKPDDMFSPQTNLSFNLIIDNELNVIADGYRDYYLKGGSVYSEYSYGFYRDIYGVLGSPYKNQPIQINGKYLERLERYDFEGTGFYDAGDTTVYTGDYLDPEKEYDANELYTKYGCADLKFYMESGDYRDYEEMVKSALSILKANNISYNTIHFYMWFRDSDVIFCDGTYTMEQLNTNINDTLKDNTFIYTQEEYDRRDAAGEEQPEILVGSLTDVLASVGK